MIVRLATGVKVCAGQSEFSAAGCRELMEIGAIDVCNFDSSWSGGPTEWRRVAALAQETFHPDRDPIWWNLIANRPRLTDGRLELSDEPGFGWELDGEYIG